MDKYKYSTDNKENYLLNAKLKWHIMNMNVVNILTDKLGIKIYTFCVWMINEVLSFIFNHITNKKHKHSEYEII